MISKQPLSRIFKQLLSYDNITRMRKIQHGYYISNFLERRRNQKSLRDARSNFRENSGNSPIISVVIPTFNKAELLTKRTIPSVLTQTYENFELIVVGDHCTDDTEQLVAEFKDKRIRFINLPERGKYPSRFWDCWMVAGSVPRNKGLELSSGEWIAPLDDDDEFSKDHLEVLLSSALQNSWEMVYGVVKMETAKDQWIDCGSFPLEWRQICHQAVLYSAKLKFLKYNVNSWKFNEPDDWNLWRRMKEAGVRIGFVNKIVGSHYLESAHRTLAEQQRSRG